MDITNLKDLQRNNNEIQTYGIIEFEGYKFLDDEQN